MVRGGIDLFICSGWDSKRAGAAALTGVPRVLTGGPGRWVFEGVDQIEDGPGQHHDVVDVQVGDDHLGRHADPCGGSRVNSFTYPGKQSALKKGLVSFTLEHGADLPPGRHPTLTGVLAQSRLQEEQRNTTEEEENKIRDEEDTCNHQKQPRVTGSQRTSSSHGREFP